MKSSSKIKDLDLTLIEDKKYLLNFFSKNADPVSLELSEALCYWLYREIKKKLKLK